MAIVSNPTTTRGVIRKDQSGNLWEWVEGGKRVTAEKISK